VRVSSGTSKPETPGSIHGITTVLLFLVDDGMVAVASGTQPNSHIVSAAEPLVSDGGVTLAGDRLARCDSLRPHPGRSTLPLLNHNDVTAEKHLHSMGNRFLYSQES
jgi:hypothetical protein